MFELLTDAAPKARSASTTIIAAVVTDATAAAGATAGAAIVIFSVIIVSRCRALPGANASEGPPDLIHAI